MRIKAAAIRREGKIWTGVRHHLIIRDIVRELGTDIIPVGGEQGFVTDDNRFVDRREAAQIAFDCGQMDHLVRTLYSEDIFRGFDT